MRFRIPRTGTQPKPGFNGAAAPVLGHDWSEVSPFEGCFDVRLIEGRDRCVWAVDPSSVDHVITR